MKNTTLFRTQDFSRFVGIPYEKYNCWGLIKHIHLELFGVTLRDYYQESDDIDTPDKRQKIMVEGTKDFRRICYPDIIFGDIILFRVLGVPSHVGLYLYDEFFIHTSSQLGASVIERLGQWKLRIDSVWRVNQ